MFTGYSGLPSAGFRGEVTDLHCASAAVNESTAIASMLIRETLCFMIDYLHRHALEA
jgi:hypothetical protein